MGSNQVATQTTELNESDAQRVLGIQSEALSDNTVAAYRSDLRDFQRWTEAKGYQSLPATADTVASYLTELVEDRGLKLSTARRRMAAISTAHTAAGIASPTGGSLRLTLQGLTKRAAKRGGEQTRLDQHDPIRTSDLVRMLSTLDLDTSAGIRDRALLLVGFAAALRRSELVDIRCSDIIDLGENGMDVLIYKSKTDQDGQGQTVWVPYGNNPDTCPVLALRAWVELACEPDSDPSAPVFRRVRKNGVIGSEALTPKSVSLVVKRAAIAAGLDPARFSGHSLRAGFATEAASAGKSEHQIAKVTRHRDMKVLNGYVRDSSKRNANMTAAGSVGL